MKAPATNTAPRRIEGTGTLEAEWRAWPGLARLPTLTLDDCIGATQRLVIVAPHPDDEILAAGGLAARHADRGGAVLVVAVTDGEASHRGNPDWPAERLAAARRAESGAGLARLLGVPPAMRRLGLPDSAVAAAPVAAALEAIVGATDVVVATWRCDGHPDHEACGEAAAAACDAVGCTLLEAPVWMWHWAAPGDARVPWSRLRTLALADDVVRRRQAAIAEHVTQLAPRGRDEGPVLTAAILERLSRTSDCIFVGVP